MPRLIPRLISIFLLLALHLAVPAGAQEKASAPGREVPFSSPGALLQALEEGAAVGDKNIGHLKARLEKSGKELAQAETALKDLQVSVAYLKASLSVTKPSLLQVQELLRTYTALESEATAGIKQLDSQIESLKKTRADDTASLNALRTQMDLLQAREPALKAPEIEKAYFHYLRLRDAQDNLAAQILDNLEKWRGVLGKDMELLAEVLPQLKHLEESWQAELLKRPVQPVSPREQLLQIMGILAEVPARARRWLKDLTASGLIGAFLWNNLAHLVGLLAFISLLVWGARRLDRRAAARFRTWRAETDDLRLLPLFLLGGIMVSNLALLGIILWIALFFWIFGMLPSAPAQLILYALISLWALRLGLQSVQAFFAGEEGGVLQLDPATARYYRRSLKVFLVYLVLGLLGVKSAPTLGFPHSSVKFLEHIFQVAMFFWVLWLLRRPFLARLIPALPGPSWFHRPKVIKGLRGLIIFLLTATLLADLLGFSNLSLYIAGGATWTGLVVVLVWLSWLAGEMLLRHFLRSGEGWAVQRYPEKHAMMQKLYRLGRLLLSILLVAGAALLSLYFWGIKPERIGWAFQWVTWGVNLGQVRLTLLSVGAALLVVYLGFWLDGVVRGLMAVKIFPRTGFDPGVQYTITTTIHYVVLILAALVALSILGFPLTSLLVVAGALGVGIGFGLQNIVNNFISGLILLFERPIKVGDILVIDGQWGKVKEIRVRSTIFQTVDRAVLIIPNSELLSHKITNWTHHGWGPVRLALEVKVPYGSDVDVVCDLLLETAKANPKVLEQPPPEAFFKGFQDSALIFVLRVYMQSPESRARLQMTHDLYRAILETFVRHGIKIISPPQEMVIKSWPSGIKS